MYEYNYAFPRLFIQISLMYPVFEQFMQFIELFVRVIPLAKMYTLLKT